MAPEPSLSGSGTTPGTIPAGSISGPNAVERHARHEVAGRRRQHVSARERGSRRGEPVFLVLEGDDPDGPADHRGGRGEEPVVGPEEETALDLDRHHATVGADAGVDDGHEHGLVGQVLDGADEQQAPGTHVVRGDRRGRGR